MMSSSCSFNCSGPPPKYEPDNDITGVGVVINYIVTSALGILIMIVYYVTSFDPSNDPFGYTIRGGAPPYRSNAWDMLLLYWIRSGPRYLLKRWRGPEFVMSNNTRYRLEEILVKCVILMGDMQIVTGLAILVSGYVQLQCGLASFKWRIILDLAWFSCLTHLSCLTMLRCHLYSHQLERVWRLSAMGTLAILLATGRLLTANERWSRAGGGRDAVPALCLIQASSAIEALEGASVTYTIQLPEDAKLSAVFVLVAFLGRVIRLSERLSQVVNRAMRRLDNLADRLLWALFNALCIDGDIYSLKRSLIWRPVFSLILTIRLTLVFWASLASEIGWVIAAFVWGLWRIIFDLSGGLSDNLEHVALGRQAWTFGQIVSVLTLLAPIISIVGAWREGLKRQNSDDIAEVLPQGPSTHLPPELPLNSTPSLAVKDLASSDAAWRSCTATLASIAVFVHTLGAYAAFITYPRSKNANMLFVLETLGIVLPAGVYLHYCIVLCSITIEQVFSKCPAWLRILLQILNCVAYMVIFLFAYLTFQVYAAIGMYVLGALLHRAIGCVRRHVCRCAASPRHSYDLAER